MTSDPKYNWKSTGPGGCDTHCIEHPCGPCHEDSVKSGVFSTGPAIQPKSDFRPDNHIIGKVYDLTQENFNALMQAWESTQTTQSDSSVARELRCARMLLNESHADYRKLNERSIELEQAIRLLLTQKYGLKHAWASCDWRKCEEHGTYARGGNWGAIEGKDGAVCPWCNADKLTEQYVSGSSRDAGEQGEGAGGDMKSGPVRTGSLPTSTTRQVYNEVGTPMRAPGCTCTQPANQQAGHQGMCPLNAQQVVESTMENKEPVSEVVSTPVACAPGCARRKGHRGKCVGSSSHEDKSRG